MMSVRAVCSTYYEGVYDHIHSFVHESVQMNEQPLKLCIRYAFYIQSIQTHIKRAYSELCLRPGTDGGDALSISLLRITKINLGT